MMQRAVGDELAANAARTVRIPEASWCVHTSLGPSLRRHLSTRLAQGPCHLAANSTTWSFAARNWSIWISSLVPPALTRACRSGACPTAVCSPSLTHIPFMRVALDTAAVRPGTWVCQPQNRQNGGRAIRPILGRIAPDRSDTHQACDDQAPVHHEELEPRR